jgi:hypothetical protein
VYTKTEKYQKEHTMADMKKAPPVIFSWEKKKKEYEKILGDEEIVKRLWEEFDMLAYMFIWFLVTAM